MTTLIREWIEDGYHYQLVKRDGVPVVRVKSTADYFDGIPFMELYEGDSALHWLADKIEAVKKPRKDEE